MSEWKKLKDELPPKPSSNPVLVYHSERGSDESLDLRIPYEVVNRSYARTDAIKAGYTHWMEVPAVPEEESTDG